MLIAIADDGVRNNEIVGEFIRLIQHSEGDAVAARDASAIRLEATGEQSQQAGLAVTVSSDDADALTLVESNGDAVEDDTGRVFEVEGFGSEQMCHKCPSLPAARIHRMPSNCECEHPTLAVIGAFDARERRSRSC